MQVKASAFPDFTGTQGLGCSRAHASAPTSRSASTHMIFIRVLIRRDYRVHPRGDAAAPGV